MTQITTQQSHKNDVSTNGNGQVNLAFLKLALDKTQEGIIWINPKAEIIYVNDTVCNLLGYSRDELKEMSIYDIDSSLTAAQWPAYWEKIAQAQTSFITNDSKYLSKAQQNITVSVKVNYACEADEQLAYLFITTIQDSHQSNRQQKASAAELQLRKQAVEASTQPITITDVRQEPHFKVDRERLAKLAADLATVAEVSTAVSTIQNTNDMLQTVVDLTKERFGLYHAHIFTLNEAKDTLVLWAGAGDIGREMVAEGREIPLTAQESLVATVGRTRQGIIRNYEREMEGFAPHPALVDTRTELAVPLVVGEELLGVLDIRSEQVHAFSETDVQIQSTFASQIAVALQNARSFENAKQAHARLQLQNSALEAAANGIAITDRQGIIIWVNPAFTDLTGYKLEEIVGKSTSLLKSGQQEPEFYEKMWQTIMNGDVWQGELINRRKDGSFYTEEMTITPVRTSDKEITHFIAIKQDVTERRLTEEHIQANETLLRTIINSTPDWIFIKDRQHRYELVNESYAQAMGIPSEDFIGRDDIEMGFPEEIVKGDPEKGIRGFWADDKEVMNSGQTKFIEAEPVVIGKATHYFNTYKVPLKNNKGEVAAVLGFGTDITRLKEAQETLVQQAAKLETVAEIGITISSSLETDKVLQNVVDLTKQNFNLYHAHIYLLDATGEVLVLTTGAGEVGRQMVAQGHSIPLRQQQSLVAQAARTGESVIINNVLEDDHFLPNLLLPNTRSEMAVPITFGDSILGVLDIQSDKVDHFTAQDIAIQTTLAAEIAVAIENARQYEQTQNALAETEAQAKSLEQLTALGLALNNISDEKEAFNVLATYASKIIQAQRTSVALLNREETHLELFATDGVKGAIPTGMVLPVQGTAIGAVAQQGEMITIPDTAGSGFMDAQRLGQVGIVSAIVAPLMVGNKIIGTINFGLTTPMKQRYGREQLIQQITSLFGTALSNSRLLSQLSRSSEVIENSPTILFRWVAADNWAVEYVSENISRFGYTPEELLSGERPYATLMHPDDITRVIEAVAASTADPEEKTITQEYRIVTKNGEVRWTDTRASIVRDKNGLATHYEGVVLDITERKAAEAEIAKRAADLATVAEVGTAVSSIQNSQEMLQKVADLTKERFGLYHAHAFLLNETGDQLILSAGAGEVGRAMVAEGRQIPLVAAGSLVATAARERQAQIRNYSGEMEGYAPHPALIDTRTEMAVPLVVGDQLLGVFDVRSEYENAFDETDVQIQSTLASQVAVALQNARQAEQTQQALAEIGTLYNTSLELNKARTIDDILQTVVASFQSPTLQSASLATTEIDQTGYPDSIQIVSNWAVAEHTPQVPLGTRLYLSDFPSSRIWINNPNEAFAVGDILDDARLDENTRAFYLQFQTMATVVIPLIIGEQWLAIIVMNWAEPQTFTKADQRLFTSVGSQASLLINNLNLLEQTRKRALEMGTVAEVGTAVSSIQNSQEMLQTVVDLTKERFGLYHAHAFLVNDAGNTLILTAGAGEVGRAMVAEGRQIPLVAAGSLVATAARERQAQIRNYSGEMEGYAPHPALIDTRTEMAVPLVVGDQLLGVFDVRSEYENAFDETDVQIQSTLASQVAVALQNARQFEQTEKARKELAALTQRLTREGWDDYLAARQAAAIRYGYNLQTIQALPEESEMPGSYTSNLIAPLEIQGAEIGRMTFQVLDEPDNDMMAVVRTVVNNLSAHIENLRLSEQTYTALAETEAQAARLEQLNEMSALLSQSTNLEELYNQVVQQTLAMFNADRVSITMLNPAKNNFTIVAATGLETEPPVGTEIDALGTPIRTSMSEGRIIEGSTAELRSVIHIPILSSNRPVGTLNLGVVEDTPFTDADKTLLQQIANMVSINMTNQQLFAAAQARAEREHQVRAITDRIRSGTDRATILKIAREELSQLLGAKKSMVQLGTQQQLITSAQTTADQKTNGETH